MKHDHRFTREADVIPFGQPPLPPHACVVDDKPHVRSFLAEALCDLGFIAHECCAGELETMVRAVAPNVIVLGPLGGEEELGVVLNRLAGFSGEVMLFGGRSAPALTWAHDYGERLGLAMLAPLGTPFREGDLGQILGGFLPIAPAPEFGVDVDEALNNGWLELWYQPKVDAHSLTLTGAEAKVCVRHPTWGLMKPAYYIPADGDPYYHALSQFVIMHAMSDWMRFAAGGNRIDISVNLPSPVLEDPDFIAHVFGKLPQDAAQGGLLIATDCASALADAAVVRKAVAQLAFHRIGIALDAIGPEGATLVGRRDLPVVEMKVQGTFVRGCANDRVRQAVCAHIVAAARDNGVRSVADGVASHADFAILRDLGFDRVQGPLFAKPMPARKFAQSVLAKSFAAWA